MKVIATIVFIFVIGNEYSLAARNITTNSTPAAPRNNSTNSTHTAARNNSTNTTDTVLVSPGVSVSKGFQKNNCLASKFGVLCASSTIDGCVTKNSKTKCGKQCICGTTECSCGKSGCYCQVNAGCRCNQ